MLVQSGFAASSAQRPTVSTECPVSLVFRLESSCAVTISVSVRRCAVMPACALTGVCRDGGSKCVGALKPSTSPPLFEQVAAPAVVWGLLDVDYVGAPNINLFTPLGQFGSRHSHAPASAAYPKIALEAIADKLFPPADAPVLTYVEDEGAFVEPEVFVGVIPASLCFGGKGIATGWRTELPQFDPKDLVRACELAAGADHAACESFAAQMKPFFRGFSGTVVPDDKGGWNVCGRYERRGDELHVLDVPPVKENDAFKEDWSKHFTLLEGDGHTDSAFHVILKDFEFEKWPSHDDIVSALQLSKRVSFDNAFLLYGSATLPKQYKSVHEVLVAHSDARLALYDRRLEHEREAECQA